MSRQARATHGDYGFAKKQKCPCDPCRQAERSYVKRLHVDHHRGITRRKDATPARVHVQRLLDAGVNLQQVAHATGGKVFTSQIRNLMWGNPVHGDKPVEWLFAHTLDALLAVTYEQCMQHEGFVPTVGIERRLQALHYMGHSMDDIAKAAGVSFSAAYRWLEADQSKLSTRNKVEAVYDRLSMVRGTNERTRWKAYREGYVPPFAWDEDTIDDPDAQPDRESVVCVVAKCTRGAYRHNLCETHFWTAKSMRGFERPRDYKTAVERMGRGGHYDRQRLLADLAALKELGYDAERAASRLGRSESYVKKIWSKA